MYIVLKVQTYLLKKGLESLKNRYGIKVTENPTDNRLLLNYDQIKSPKTAAIVQECRGLCLNKVDYSLISKSFNRFFNFTENRANDNKFDWTNCIAQEKVDGSLINFYHWEGRWRVQTRGSFGNIPFYDNGPTPEQLVFEVLDNRINRFDKRLSYALELCSLHNKVVREYKTPQVFLLGVFDKEVERPFDGLYMPCWSVQNHSFYTGVPTPEVFPFHSIKEVEEYIRKRSHGDKTFEGIVLRDKNNVRIKVKNPDYLALHRIKSESSNLYMPKNLIGFVLDGETSELLIYFPEVKDTVDKMSKILEVEYNLLEATWQKIRGLESRKDFALSVPKDLKTKSLLFIMRDRGGSLSELWKESGELLLRALF